jgi:hypothetical protein
MQGGEIIKQKSGHPTKGFFPDLIIQKEYLLVLLMQKLMQGKTTKTTFLGRVS